MVNSFLAHLIKLGYSGSRKREEKREGERAASPIRAGVRAVPALFRLIQFNLQPHLLCVLFASAQDVLDLEKCTEIKEPSQAKERGRT